MTTYPHTQKARALSSCHAIYAYLRNQSSVSRRRMSCNKNSFSVAIDSSKIELEFPSFSSSCVGCGFPAMFSFQPRRLSIWLALPWTGICRLYVHSTMIERRRNVVVMWWSSSVGLSQLCSLSSRSSRESIPRAINETKSIAWIMSPAGVSLLLIKLMR